MKYNPDPFLPCLTIDHDGVCHKLDNWIETQATNKEPGEGTPEWERLIHQLAVEHPSAVVSESEDDMPMPVLIVDRLPVVSSAPQAIMVMVQRSMEQPTMFIGPPSSSFNLPTAQPGGSSGSYKSMEPGTDALSSNYKLIRELTGGAMSAQSMGPRTWVAEHPQRSSHARCS